MGREKKHRLVTHKCHTCGKMVGRALMSGVWDWRSGNLYTFMYESGGSLMHESATHCNTMLQQTLKCGKKVGFWYSGSGSGHFCQKKGNIHQRVTSDKRRRRWGERTKNTQTYYIHMFIRIYLSAYVCVCLSLSLYRSVSLSVTFKYSKLIECFIVYNKWTFACRVAMWEAGRKRTRFLEKIVDVFQGSKSGYREDWKGWKLLNSANQNPVIAVSRLKVADLSKSKSEGWKLLISATQNPDGKLLP